jgi:enoyl-CoA hydratase/carnithine racemase
VSGPEASSPLQGRREGRIEIVRLNRPAQRNAMSAALVDELIAVISAMENDPDMGALVLVGAGAGFCAGSDLGGLAAMDAAARSGFEAASGRVARMIGQSPKPILAAVHGFALGGGLTLAAACDIVLTEADAKWSLPEVPLGLFPAWGLDAVVRRVGVPAARRLAWGIDTLSGREAHALGLADEIVEGNVLSAAMDRARAIAGLPSVQAHAVKRFFSKYFEDEAADVAANGLFVEMTKTAEANATFRRFSTLQSRKTS